MRFPYLQSAEDLAKLVDEIGFLPFFRNNIEGFSIEELTPAELWFTSEPGPWEWKGPVIRATGAAYGKFFNGKAMYVSRQYIKDFANYRRDGYDFDSRIDEGIAPYKDEKLYTTLQRLGPCLSRTLKAAAGYSGEGRLKGFDAVITRLQAQCYVCIDDFVYEKDKNGKTYGWGVAKYATFEQRYGDGFREGLYSKKPSRSYDILLKHLKSVLPDVDESLICGLLGARPEWD